MKLFSKMMRLLTPIQLGILWVGVLLVCALAGALVYVFRSPVYAVSVEVPTITSVSTTPKTRFLPARSTPTPRPTATIRPTRTLTPTRPVTPPPEACVPSNTEILLGQVVAVQDGESIQVQVLDGRTLWIVYAGITAPPESMSKNNELVSGQQVTLVKDVSGMDEMGRLPRYVLVGNRFINYELVRKGFAQVIDSPDQACAQVFREAQTGAQADQFGLWVPTPVPTLTFVPTVGINPGDLTGCSCSVKWTCANFRSQARAQACFNACNDYNSRLDEDHDGLACEELP